ncbi:bile acid:sodium symporter [Limosilactobacillus fermentum]|uniref:Bile acid:sodium symporter n=1 Tax=Limosilactobacillus fermentum TaxID=1613 RepID=A0AAJ5ZXF7_LIMFE|nr:bile acid:sodium symporter [Limosilactobacillus fermentum]WFR88305.1 bile acid:sodium symporter [Limosilactobacillus fermentum]
MSTIEIVLVPIILGVLVHTMFKKQVDKFIQAMPLISQVAILLIIGAVVSKNHTNIFTAATALDIPVVILHNLSGYGIGFLFSKLIRLREPQRKAITFEVGMQDSSLGATLAIKYFAPAAAIPSTIFSIWHNISGSAFRYGGVTTAKKKIVTTTEVPKQLSQLIRQEDEGNFLILFLFLTPFIRF